LKNNYNFDCVKILLKNAQPQHIDAVTHCCSNSLLEIDFSEKIKDLIAVIKLNYWPTDDEKKQLKLMFYENEKSIN